MESGEDLLQRDLQTWRVMKANDMGIKSFDIFSNKSMLDIVKRRPATVSDLMGVPGLGSKAVSKYGREIIQIVSRYWWSDGEGRSGSATTAPEVSAAWSSMNPNAGMVWTEEQDDQLLSMHRAGMKADEIAVFMKRATGAVTSRLKRHREATRGAAFPSFPDAAGKSPYSKGNAGAGAAPPSPGSRSPAAKRARSSGGGGSQTARGTSGSQTARGAGRSMPFSFNPTPVADAPPSTPRRSGGSQSARGPPSSPSRGAPNPERSPLRSAANGNRPPHSPRVPSSSSASVKRVKEELKAHLRHSSSSFRREDSASHKENMPTPDQARRAREEAEKQRRQDEAAAKLKQWQQEQQVRRDKWRAEFRQQKAEEADARERERTTRDRARESPRARPTPRASGGGGAGAGAGPSPRTSTGGGGSSSSSRGRASGGYHSSGGAGGAGGGAGGSGSARQQQATREAKQKDEERTKRHATVALWGKWLTKSCPDLSQLGVAELKQFLSLSAMPSAQSKGLLEKADLLEAAKGRVQAWEVARVRACKGVSTEHYCVLRVSPRRASDGAALKKAFRQMSLLVHPDKNKTEGCSEAFHQVKEAYEVLSDDGRRRAYEQMVHERTGK